MFFLAMACAAVCAGIFGWYALRVIRRAWRRYQEAFGQSVTARMDEFFLFMDPQTLWQANLGLCGAFAAGMFAATGSVWTGAVAGLASLAAPRHIVARLRERRMRRFEAQLPDLLLALCAALRAGAGLQAALRQLVPQIAAPLSQELGLLLRQQRMGVSWEDALAGLKTRMPSEGTSLMVSVLLIASRSGGSVAHTLEGVAETLRTRLHMASRVDALTAQGRLQAWLMCCMPVGLGAALYLLDPQAMAPLWTTAMGWAVLALITVLQSAGIFLVRRIVHIDI